MLAVTIISSIALLSIQSVIEYSEGVVGGLDAEENRYPYQASIRAHGEHKCGGSLLNHRWLLSAAHCLVDENPLRLIIVLGSNSLVHGGIAFNVSESILHPNYVKGQHHDDIALIKFGTWINYTPAIAPVKLPSVDHNSFYSNLNQLATFTGWGREEIDGPFSLQLKSIQLPVINLDDCRKIFPSTSLSSICTFAGIRQGLCYGDGGSPLVDADQIIIGFGSWGAPCARGYPDVHTSVRSYISWIKTIIVDGN